MLKLIRASTLALSLPALAGCSAWQPMCPEFKVSDDGWQYRTCQQGATQNTAMDKAARLAALEREHQQLTDELATAKQENGTLSGRVKSLESQVADRDREIAALRSSTGDSSKLANQLSGVQGDLEQVKARNADLERQLAAAQAQMGALQADQSKGNLAKAEKDLLRALQPEIAKGTVSVHQSGNALIINLASSLLFDSGQDQLKANGTDTLKRVGGVLKDFPEKQVHVAGYTDNVAIKGALKKKFPSNKELSDSRAKSAAQALRDGGVSSNLSAAGHGDSNPIASNDTVEGRAKNRRVEISITS